MRRSKRMLTLLLAFAIIIVMPVCAGALALKDSLGISIDGYMSESAWESSAMKSFTLSSGNKAFLRLLADKKGVYVGVLVFDLTPDDADNISVSVSGIGGSHSIKLSRSGSKLSGSGTYAVDNSSNQYSAECKFSATISGAGSVSATLTVTDDGNKNSGSTSLSLTVPTSPQTTKPTTTTTKAPTQPPTQTPNTPNTKPPAGNSGTPSTGGSSGGNSTGGNSNIGGNTGSNNNISGSVTLMPPAGETTDAGEITNRTTPEGETITTAVDAEDTTIPAEETTASSTGNLEILSSNWSFYVILIAILILAGIVGYVVYGHRKNQNKK